jgi:uncharacterized protein (TIGR02594 family)
MVDFGDTLFDTKLDSSVPIVQPVADKSSEYFAQGLKSGIDGLGNFLALDAKNKATAASSALNEDIVEKMSLLADGREQGKLTLAQANRQLRVWSNEWVSNAPGEADSIFTLINKLGGDRGIAGSIYTETPAEKGNRERLEAGAKAGWDVSSPEGIAAFDAFTTNTRQLEIQAQQLTHLQQSNQIVSEGQKAAYAQTFQKSAASAYPWVINKISEAQMALQGAGTPQDRQAVIDALKMEVAKETGKLSSYGALAGSEKIDYLLKPMNDLVAQFENTASGKSTVEALKNSIELSKAQMEVLMFADPEVGRLFLANAVAPFTDQNALRALGAAQLKIAAGINTGVNRGEDGSVTFEQKPSDVIDKAENVATVFNLEKSYVTNLLKGGESVTPEVTQAMNDKIAVILSSTARNGGAESDATNFNGVVDYLADTSVGQWMENNYNEIGPKIAKDAAVVVERQYSDVVLNLVNERWVQAGTSILTGMGSESKDAEIDKIIEPVWNGYGIEFRAKDAYKDDFRVYGIVQELNKGKDSVAGPVNRMIRMAAHLQGTTDYEKVYNENFKNKLWVTGDEFEQKAVTQTGQQMKDAPQLVDRPSDLTLEDFDSSELEKIINESKAANPGAMLLASTPEQIAQAYIGADENDSEQAAAISAFIKKNAGIDINPATTAWCAAFLDAVLHASGSEGTGKLNARSYLAWGIPVDSPQLGDVVVLQRGGKDSWQGHVGLYMGTNEDGSVRVLGGNTGDKVGEADYAPDKVLGFRRAG